jgi:hypothetical protein
MAALDWQQAIRLMLSPWITLLEDNSWIGVIVELTLGAIGAMFFHRIGTHILESLSAPFPFSHRLVRYGHRAGGMAVFFLVSHVILRNQTATLAGLDTVQHLSALAMIVALTWLSARCIKAIGDTIIELNPVHAPDNL